MSFGPPPCLFVLWQTIAWHMDLYLILWWKSKRTCIGSVKITVMGMRMEIKVKKLAESNAVLFLYFCKMIRVSRIKVPTCARLRAHAHTHISRLLKNAFFRNVNINCNHQIQNTIYSLCGQNNKLCVVDVYFGFMFPLCTLLWFN